MPRGLACWAHQGLRRRTTSSRPHSRTCQAPRAPPLPPTVTHDRIDMSQDNPDKAAGSPEPDETTVDGSPQPEETTAAAASDAPPVAEPVVEPELELEEEGVGAEDLDSCVAPAGTVVVTGPGLVARLGAEAFGTFTLVLVGV